MRVAVHGASPAQGCGDCLYDRFRKVNAKPCLGVGKVGTMRGFTGRLPRKNAHAQRRERGNSTKPRLWRVEGYIGGETSPLCSRNVLTAKKKSTELVVSVLFRRWRKDHSTTTATLMPFIWTLVSRASPIFSSGKWCVTSFSIGRPIPAARRRKANAIG